MEDANTPGVQSLPERIGLCLSGGGYRAAAFHLGTLMYLHRIKLLGRVERLSTVSGGTFTGAKYVLSLVNGIAPEVFFESYYDELKRSRIFPNALEILASERQLHGPKGRKDIITSAAQSYCETMFCKGGGQPALFGDILHGNTAPLAEIAFNATDFRTGQPFRFQKNGDIGSTGTPIKRKDAEVIRMGDIVAASSCFPGGFEPIEFPGDFGWPPKWVPDVKNAAPLMDGGVYDNQGLESLLMDRKNTVPIDLVIISDTDRKADSLYEMPASVADAAQASKSQTKLVWKLFLCWNPTLGTLAWVSWLLQVLCGLSAAAIGMNLLSELRDSDRSAIVWIVLTNLFPMLLAAFASVLLAVFRSTFKNKLLSKIPQLQLAGWEYVSKVRLVDAIDMCWRRVSSLVALASNIFMKRIRGSGYKSVFKDPAYQGKLVSNLIYSIHAPKDPRAVMVTEGIAGEAETSQATGPVPPASEKLYAVAEAAANVPTLLWFQNNGELPLLVATGQATTCQSLLKHFLQMQVKSTNEGTQLDSAFNDLLHALQRDWEAFGVDPYFMAPKPDNA